jgi:hypothetical protein
VSTRKKFHIMKQRQKENICNICGAPNAELLVIGKSDNVVSDILSLFICKKCHDSDTEFKYVKKLLDKRCVEDEESNKLFDEYKELCSQTNGNPDAEDLKKITHRLLELGRYEAVKKIILDRRGATISKNKAGFIEEYGLGLKHVSCEICGQNSSYLFIVENHLEDPMEILLEISGWFCADCLATGMQEKYTKEAFHKLIHVRKRIDEIKARDMGFLITPSSSKKVKQDNFSSYLSAIDYDLLAQEVVYSTRAKCINESILAYEGTPVKIVIEKDSGGDPCFYVERNEKKITNAETIKNLPENYRDLL